MSAASPVARAWTRAKWLFAIAIVFAAHLGLIFAFGNRKPIVIRPSAEQSTLRFTTRFGEWQELNDPTLLAVPHPRGFAGLSWMKAPTIAMPVFRWDETIPPLGLDALHLGGMILNFVQSNAPSAMEFAALPSPDFPMANAAFGEAMGTKPSALRLGAEFSGRRLLNPPHLDPRRATDVLTNSIVQVRVLGDGMVFSAVQLSPGNVPRSPEQIAADQSALEIARTLRFTSSGGGTFDSTLGRIIFEWQTLPPLENGATNSPARSP